jgi:hypothetical protein
MGKRLEKRPFGKIMIKMIGCEKWMMKLAHNRPGLEWLHSMLAVLSIWFLLR